jgi:predicted lipid-binding transport protein (Tim44 family)
MGLTRKPGKVLMRRLAAWATMLLFLLVPGEVWARGGGGCLAEGTPVLTPAGPRSIEGLRSGDTIWGVKDGALVEATVHASMMVNPPEFLEIRAGGETLRVTPEHPVMVGPGEYRVAKGLVVGDVVYLLREGVLSTAVVRSARWLPGEGSAHNLLVSPGGTYVAGGLLVHNKGCFLPESPILRSDGTEMPISEARPGDEILAFTPEGRLVPARVRDVLRVDAEAHVILQTDRTTLRVTEEHPFYVGRGTFKTLEILKPGDTIFAWDGQTLSEQRILSLHRVSGRVPVFNLQTDRPNTFFAGRIAVHNKGGGGGGGCFPSGTKITTPSGMVRIEEMAAGDEVLAIREGGQPVPTPVRELFLTRNAVLRIETDKGAIRATAEHPIGLWRGGFRSAAELRRGDRIRHWEDGRIVQGRIRRIVPAGKEEMVFNLQVGAPHTFVAEGVVVHNKGGSSSSSSHSSSSSSGGSSGEMGTFEWILMAGFLVVWCVIFFGILFLIRGKKSKSENLDFSYSPKDVSEKSGKTEKLLLFLGQQDPSLQPEELRQRAQSTFLKLQECWQARDYGPMQPLMMEALFAQHMAQLQGMEGNHEINRIENVKVERVDLVNVRYTEKADQREFTALVSASARDYYVDDRTDKFLRGDKSPAKFQEFWTFHRVGDQWLLREIEQAGESDILKDENFVEMLTDDTVKGIYGETAKEGDAGPWVAKGEEAKANRTERLLNFLVQTDKLWDRSQMLQRAREVFMAVYLARESGDPAKVPQGDLFPTVASSLRDQIQQWHQDGVNVEYRNLCVRKAEMILVRNYPEQSKDEFTVRVDAHAQKVVRKGDRTMSQQQYVTPFEEYWTFGRLDGQWKLKEVLPPSRGKKMVGMENVDEESSAGQLEWYYRQTRAN